MDYSWVPFSGGAHMCIGLHFANMQIKLVLFDLLKNYSWQVAEAMRCRCSSRLFLNLKMICR
ncbi:MAG: cytochrome P450 [SAR86 cluster bacterium]|uniref:Cytochrome P450 n=1 Tax=SAR86 cluster bacterium TaxID=2030880 RepID=A0A972VUP6_9GAMM|nr:cytochrome P450 [SAR86 cluster bacterium]